MDLVTIAVLVLTGIGVGFASGLLGVGGCFIMVPVLYWIYSAVLDPKVAILTAFGTNLGVVFPTAISGAYRHSKKKAVNFRIALVIGAFGALGAVFGSTVATFLPAKILKTAFAIVIIASAIRMLTSKPPKESKAVGNPILWAILGFIAGAFSGFVGIGGGVIIVPILAIIVGLRIHEAVGTSTAVMAFTSLAGLIGYILNGLRDGIFGCFPVGHLVGYFNPESCLALAVTSVPMAQVGATFGHVLPAKWLKLAFVVVMLYMAMKMLGVL